MKTTPLMIHGSCVSRDIIRVHNDLFTSVDYIARQSLISAFSEPTNPPTDWGISSKFQIKNLKGDFLSNSPERIEKGSHDAEILVIDLISEKHGVIMLESNKRVSATPTLRKTTHYKKIQNKPRAALGSAEHFELFIESINRLKRLLVDLDLFERTAVLNAPFTDTVIDGEDINHRVSAEEWNHLFTPYYGELEASGFHVFPQLPSELAKSTIRHTWGKSQNHYVDDAYTWWARQILEFKKTRP